MRGGENLKRRDIAFQERGDGAERPKGAAEEEQEMQDVFHRKSPERLSQVMARKKTKEICLRGEGGRL